MRRSESLGVAITRYIAERQRRGELRPGSAKATRSILRRFAARAGPDLQVASLTRRHVNQWWANLEGGPTYLRNQLSTVRTFCRWAIENEMLRTDPTRHLRPPREPRRVPKIVAQDDVTLLVAACPDARARLIILWMVHLGLRSCEVARLEVGDVDYGARLVKVRGKAGHERLLPVPSEAWDALTDYLAEAPAAAGPLVRCQAHTRPLTPGSVSQLVRRLFSDADVKRYPYDGMSAHGLRRTCATSLLDRGAHIRQVQSVLGHSQLASTERYLRWADAGELRPVVEGRRYRPQSRTSPRRPPESTHK